MANDKHTTGGAGYIPTSSSPEDIKNMLNFFGTYFLKGLGAIGQLMTAPLTQSDPMSMPYKSKLQLDQEKAILAEGERQVGTVMSHLSPLNYGVALATGNGWDPIAGELEIALWEPYLQALARGAELYTIGKVTKGIKNGVVSAYNRFNRPKLPLIKPPANADHFRFADMDYSDYWTPIDYSLIIEESAPPEYTFNRSTGSLRNFTHPMVTAESGVQLRSLMKGSPLEAQLDGWGNIKTKVLRLYFGEPKKPGRGRSKIERQIVNEVLDSYGNRSKVNFNEFKRDVFYKLLKLLNGSRVHDLSAFSGHNAGRLGYHLISYSDAPQRYSFVLESKFPERFVMNEDLDIIDNTTGKVLTPEDFENYKNLIDYYINEDNVDLYSYDLPVIDLIPRKILGQVMNKTNRSFGENAVFTVSNEPDVLYVANIDSKWATRPKLPIPTDGAARSQFAANKARVAALLVGIKKRGSTQHLYNELQGIDFTHQAPMIHPLMPYLKQTFFRRQIQSALNEAAKLERTKVRFPTESTITKLLPPKMILDPAVKQLEAVYYKFKTKAEQTAKIYGEDSPQYKAAKAMEDNAFNVMMKASSQKVMSTGSQLKLSRFRSIPRILKQLLPDLEPKIVFDSQGNGWIEVSIPHNYQYTEQMFKKGGKL